MSSPSPIKVVIADDHALFRTGIRSVFSTYSKDEFSFIGEAANGQELLALLEVMLPDVVLMDIEMPQMNGIEATAIIKRQYPRVRVIALSHSDAASRILDMTRAGSDGYLSKDTGLDELTHAIRTVHAGVPYFTPAVTIHLATGLREEKRNDNRNNTLTRRETEILQRICDGESSKEIATALFVSKRTVDTFREKIMNKLGAKNLVQLLRYAFQNQLVEK